MNLIDEIVASSAEMAQLRRDIHAHPELCFQEVRTADLVAQKLSEWGIPTHRGLGTTGVVGIIKNGASERAIGLRADMDALPMQEKNTFAHASTHAGKMHDVGMMDIRPCSWLRPNTSAPIGSSMVRFT